MRKKGGYIYFLSNKTRTTLYIGVTSDIVKRIYEHITGKYEGFSKRYKLYDLLYYEEFPDIIQAIAREKQLKNWHREWKWRLIKAENPDWKDLAEGWYDDLSCPPADPNRS